MKKRVWILCVMTAVLIGVATACSTDASVRDDKQNQKKNVLYLDGDEVTEDEYALLAAEYKNQVAMQYSTEQVNSDDFWETEIDGETPVSKLEELILDQLKYNYAVKHLAVEADVIEDYTYAELQDEREGENQERSGQLENEETVYGLTSYDDSAYYNYWYSNLETQWKNSWILENTDITETDCRNYYEDHMEEYTYHTGVTVIYAELPYDSEAERGKMQNTGLSLSHALESSHDLKEIKEAFPEVDFEELELNDLDTQEGMSGVYTQRWQIASQMEKGQVFGPYEGDGAVCVIKCIDRTENGELGFDGVKSRIKRLLQVETANQCISGTVEKMKVEDGGISTESVILKTVSN